MAELLLNISKLGVVVGEVPLLLRYDMKKGASKMRIGRTIFRTFMMVMRHRFGRLSGKHTMSQSKAKDPLGRRRWRDARLGDRLAIVAARR